MEAARQIYPPNPRAPIRGTTGDFTGSVSAAGATAGARAALIRRVAKEHAQVDAMQLRASELRARAIPEAESRAAVAKQEAARAIEGRPRRLVGAWAERLEPDFQRIVGAAEIIDAGVKAIARQYDVALPASFPTVLNAAEERNL